MRYWLVLLALIFPLSASAWGEDPFVEALIQGLKDPKAVAPLSLGSEAQCVELLGALQHFQVAIPRHRDSSGRWVEGAVVGMAALGGAALKTKDFYLSLEAVYAAAKTYRRVLVSQPVKLRELQAATLKLESRLAAAQAEIQRLTGGRGLPNITRVQGVPGPNNAGQFRFTGGAVTPMVENLLERVGRIRGELRVNREVIATALAARGVLAQAGSAAVAQGAELAGAAAAGAAVGAVVLFLAATKSGGFSSLQDLHMRSEFYLNPVNRPAQTCHEAFMPGSQDSERMRQKLERDFAVLTQFQQEAYSDLEQAVPPAARTGLASGRATEAR